MQTVRFPVDVIMERVPLANRWVSESWRPSAVEVRDGGGEEGAVSECLQDDASGTVWRLGGHAIELHPSEAEGYFLNLTAPHPCVFVMWRMYDDAAPAARPVVVTVSYNEAGRLLDAGERVDNVPLPEAIAARTRSFVAAHYKPEPKRKVARNDPFAAGAFVRDRDPGRRD